MLQLNLNKEKTNAHFFLKIDGLKIHVRPYFYVESNKLIRGYVGLINRNNKTFSTYFESGVLSLEEVLIILTGELQKEEFLNQEVLINTNNK